MRQAVLPKCFSKLPLAQYEWEIYNFEEKEIDQMPGKYKPV